MEMSREMLKQLGLTDEAIKSVEGMSVVQRIPDPDIVIPDTITKGVILNNKPELHELSDADITPVSDMLKYTSGEIVCIPGFTSDKPLVVKLKRPSLLALVKSGRIPNSLMSQATKLFQSGASSLGDKNTVSDMYDIMQVVIEAAMVKPTYNEIKEAGVELSDEQMMAIFSYTQQGVKALEQFR